MAEGKAAGLAIAAPPIDFGKFGPIETKALSKIQKISGPALHRNWVRASLMLPNSPKQISLN